MLGLYNSLIILLKSVTLLSKITEVAKKLLLLLEFFGSIFSTSLLFLNLDNYFLSDIFYWRS